MKRIKAAVVALAIPLAVLGAGDALARGGHGGHFHHGGHARFGVFIGAPLFWPWYYPPSYYYPPVVAVPSSPPVYIEQGEEQPAPAQSNYWYYCAEGKGYYPYVKECPGGWQRVPPRPSAG